MSQMSTNAALCMYRRLPPYQLNMFLNKGYRKYVCVSCVPTPSELKRKLYEQADRINSCTHNRKEIVACEGIIKSKSENEKKLNTVVKELQARCKEYIKDKNCVTDLIQTQFSVLESKLVTGKKFC